MPASGASQSGVSFRNPPEPSQVLLVEVRGSVEGCFDAIAVLRQVIVHLDLGEPEIPEDAPVNFVAPASTARTLELQLEARGAM